MLCVVSHDAGGAEVLASYVARKGLECSLLLEGPARKVFERRLGRPVTTLSLPQAMEQCDQFLTGSSWQSDIEWQVIRAARASGKRVVTFLDHWGHYRERFIRQGEECLPDAIWTGDEEAHALALKLFPGMPVEIVANPYVEDVREAVAGFAAADKGAVRAAGLRILFVCEPLSEHGQQEFGDPLHWGYTEFDALRFFFSRLSLLGSPVAEAVIRPHPSERPGKYDALARELQALAGIPVHVGGGEPLLQEIAHCDVVAGCESMAMVVGLVAGRRVISAIPPGGRPSSLPQRQIENLGEPGSNKA
jgi:hypothetical protein